MDTAAYQSPITNDANLVLRQFGNTESATVLFVLDEVIRSGQAFHGDLGVILALGSGCVAEGALLRW